MSFLNTIVRGLNKLAFFAAPIFYKLLAMSLAALAIGGVILLIRRVADDRIPPLWKFLLWLPVLVALLVPYRPTSSFSLVQQSRQIERISFRQQYDAVEWQLFMAQQADLSDERQRSAVKTLTEREATVFTKSLIFDVVVPLLWLFGAIIMLGALLISRLLLERDLRRVGFSEKYADLMPRCRDLLNKCCNELRIERKIDVVIQDKIASPAISGLFRPTILLPNYVAEMGDRSLTYIIYHELGHYQRNDLLVNYLLLLIQAVYWFNPLVWLLFKVIREDIEILTDAHVISKIGQANGKAYAQSLVEVLGHSHQIALLPKLLCMVDSKKNTARRINMIKLSEKFKKHRLRVAAVCLLLIGVVSALFLTYGKKHSIAIYIASGTEIPTMQYQTIVDEGVPVLTEQDMLAYNPQLHMLFLKDSAMPRLNEDFEARFLTRGGSARLNAEKNDSFIVAVDGKPLYGGHFESAVIDSYIPPSPYIIDRSEGLQIAFRSTDENEDLRSSSDLLNAFKDMDMLTERVFDIPAFDSAGSFDVAALWHSRVPYVANDSEVGRLVDALKFPLNVTVESFERDLNGDQFGLTVNLKTTAEIKQHYGAVANRSILKQNALMLFSLIENIEYVRFVFDDQINPYQYEYDSAFANDYLGDDYFAKTATLGGFYDLQSDLFVLLRLGGATLRKNINLFVWKNSEGQTCYSLLWGEKDAFAQSEIYDAQRVMTDLAEVRQKLAAYRADGTHLAIVQMSIDDFSKTEMSALSDQLADSLPANHSGSIGGYAVDEAGLKDFVTIDNDGIHFVVDDAKRLLTADEVRQVNLAFTNYLPLLDGDDVHKVAMVNRDKAFYSNPVCHFLLSYYERPQQIGLSDFIDYYYSFQVLNERAPDDLQEFSMLQKMTDFPISGTIADSPVPIKRVKRVEVDSDFKIFLDISLDEVTNRQGTYYLADYDAFYNRSSDAAVMSFKCQSGEIDGDIIRLYSERDVLTLKRVADRYCIVSYLEK